MAGVSVDEGKGKRRSMDSEINMIPMIDLLMVTVSFLLITAVWVQSQRLEANAQVPGPVTEPPPCGADCKEEARLHVETSDPTKFVLAWKEGRTVLHSTEIAREPRRAGSYPALAARVSEEWKASGSHRDASDKRFDRAVVHAANDMPYSELIAVMDAVAHAKRGVSSGGKLVETTAFEVTFATD
ncbi:MAG: biopolymer transporter ExbD [Labilithrix sp.]|nr:biopolymer transporter ExbD [Labilithrix sp.]MBX3224720.1 biopolymer transporter ExbD [Labilithrix sp.]